MKVQSTFDGFVGHAGGDVLLRGGDEYDSAHSLVQANPHLFTEPEPEPAKPATKATAAKPAAPKAGAKDG